MEDKDADAPAVPVSEEQEVVEQPEPSEAPEAPKERTVPLEALEAERKKRQELEAQNRVLQEFMVKSKAEEKKAEEVDEDPGEFMTKAEFKKRLEKATATQKRELLEEAFCSAKPEAIELINRHLETIIKRKPWLAQTIETAQNRYARAYEIVQDYMPKEEPSPVQKLKNPKDDAKRIVENSQKPGNPAAMAKPANMSGADYMKSIGGTKEFTEYRKKLLSGK
jgi:hypothetical protein